MSTEPSRSRHSIFAGHLPAAHSWWRRWLFVLLLIFGAAGAAAQARAAQLVMFESEYCPYCIRWKQDIGVVYDKTEEGRRAPLRIVDIHEPRPEDLKHIRGIYWTPTFVLLDDEGREVGRIEGYQYEDAFWFQLGELLKRLKTGKADKAEKDGARTGAKAAAEEKQEESASGLRHGTR
jgi:thioredoxin-related protein